MTSSQPLLEARGLVKSYGRVEALRGVDFEVHPGEVVALVGDNGAGKSTLVKTLAGALRPDRGEIFLDGVKQDFRSPLDARDAGIETVYQDLALAGDLPIWANVFLGREARKGPKWLGWLDKQGMRAQAKAELAKLHISIPSVDIAIDQLSGGQRQAVAVARSVAWGRNLVLMDEPTANLGVEEQENVHRLIRHLADSGVAVVLISHNLLEIFTVADRIVVLRRGSRVASILTTDTTTAEIVGYITGANEMEKVQSRS